MNFIKCNIKCKPWNVYKKTERKQKRQIRLATEVFKHIQNITHGKKISNSNATQMKNFCSVKNTTILGMKSQINYRPEEITCKSHKSKGLSSLYKKTIKIHDKGRNDLMTNWLNTWEDKLSPGRIGFLTCSNGWRKDASVLSSRECASYLQSPRCNH